MSKRGKELASEAAKRMLELSGVTKAYGTVQFDQMAKACRDDGETLAIVEKAAASVLASKHQVDRERLMLAAQQDQLSAMTQQVGVYLDRIEKIYRNMPPEPQLQAYRYDLAEMHENKSNGHHKPATSYGSAN